MICITVWVGTIVTAAVIENESTHFNITVEYWCLTTVQMLFIVSLIINSPPRDSPSYLTSLSWRMDWYAWATVPQIRHYVVAANCSYETVTASLLFSLISDFTHKDVMKHCERQTHNNLKASVWRSCCTTDCCKTRKMINVFLFKTTWQTPLSNLPV